ncbi:MAG: hypothetical protein KJZ90_00015 [Rhodocyclaceae bacterium]|nr:hypothetical protein [Rhodocyclaceae bacterium]
MKAMIASRLAQHGWQKDQIVDAFSKSFETVVAPKRATIWLKFDRVLNCWWLANGDFTSAGENVLATSHAIFPVGAPQNEIEQTIDTFVAEMERRIAGAYSVRLRDLKPLLDQEAIKRKEGRM